MPTPDASLAGTFAIGGDLVVNRLGNCCLGDVELAALSGPGPEFAGPFDELGESELRLLETIVFSKPPSVSGTLSWQWKMTVSLTW